MPLFGKKHKSPRRKLEAGSANTLKSNVTLTENSGDPNDPSVKLKLGGNELIFQDGEWYSGEWGTSPRAVPLILVRVVNKLYKL